MDVLKRKRWAVNAGLGGAFLCAPVGVYYALGFVHDINILAGGTIFIPTQMLMIASILGTALTAGFGAIIGWGTVRTIVWAIPAELVQNRSGSKLMDQRSE